MHLKFYNKACAFISSGVFAFSMCGCSNQKKSDNSSKTAVSISTNTVPVTSLVTTYTTDLTTAPVTTTFSTMSTTAVVPLTTTELIVTSIFTTTTEFVTTMPQSYFGENTFTSDDQSILDYFHELGDSVKDSINTEEFLEKGKMYFIYCVDFLFYDGEIKGIKFSDMTDTARQQLLCDITFIDTLICSKFPDYKETISDGAGAIYDKASEIIKDGSQNIKDFSREKLGYENYYKLEQYKDIFIEQTYGDFEYFIDILGVGKSKLSDWYSNFKGQN